jgi:predicted enzyme related to lactoylglutathione lyase
MKRFHVHLHVNDLHTSIAFYSRLFAMPPTRIEVDYIRSCIVQTSVILRPVIGVPVHAETSR